MKIKFFRVIAVILILALASLACGGGSDGQTPTKASATKASATKASATKAATKEAVATKAPKKTPVPDAKEQRNEVGGFAFSPVAGYQLETEGGIVSMLAPDANSSTGPMFILAGGTPAKGTTNESLLADLAESTSIDVSEAEEVEVDGVSGLAVNISTTEGDKEVSGRVVVLMVSPAQQFTILGGAPSDQWDSEIAPLFEQVLASISFFEPSGGDVEPTKEAATGGTLRQWATSADASSAYGDSGWAADQATGKPNVTDCADNTSAWASQAKDTEEWIELGYDTPVVPTEVNIYESYNPDQVILVSLLDEDGEYHEIYSGAPSTVDECPYVLSIPVEGADYKAVGVKITIDQSEVGDWNEIDAVELVGTAK